MKAGRLFITSKMTLSFDVFPDKKLCFVAINDMNDLQVLLSQIMGSVPQLAAAVQQEALTLNND